MGRRRSEGFDPKFTSAPRGRRVSFEVEGNGLVRCRYSKCGKTSNVTDARRTFKTCHNCAHVYCSRGLLSNQKWGGAVVKGLIQSSHQPREVVEFLLKLKEMDLSAVDILSAERHPMLQMHVEHLKPVIIVLMSIVRGGSFRTRNGEAP
uniref:Uncharacterized protein n=1 Tax=Homalodisca liturata TaxID=320908 RepID=A0A1B6IGB0_9HEMI